MVDDPASPRRRPAGVDGAAITHRWGEARRLVTRPAHLRRTLATAVVVGTVLFAINQLDVVLAGRATALTWCKVAITYVVPFLVSNVGILIGREPALRRPERAGR